MTRRRFTDADKWEDPWYIELPPEAKLFWVYLCDRCDLAGVYEPSQRLVAFHMGMTADLSDARAWFGDRVEQLSDGKWRLVKFIDFQQPKGLTDCKPHVAIIKLLRHHGANAAADFYQSQIDTSKGGRGGVTDPSPRGPGKSKSLSLPISNSSSGEGSKGEPSTSRADFVRWLHRNHLAAEKDSLIEQWIGVAIKAGAPKDSAGPIDWALRIDRLRLCCAQAKRTNGKCIFPSHAEPFARDVKEQIKTMAKATT